MYNRYENGVHPREPIMDLLSATKDHSSSLDDHVQYLESVSNPKLNLVTDSCRGPLYRAMLLNSHYATLHDYRVSWQLKCDGITCNVAVVIVYISHCFHRLDD